MSQEIVTCGGHEIPVWPDGQAFEPQGDPTIMTTTFGDTDRYHPGLIAHILEAERAERRHDRYFLVSGGAKLHHLERWGLPEAELLNARAKAFFKRALSRSEAVIDVSWANVYRAGEFIMPHAHIRSTASLVYFLSFGDRDPEHRLSGSFCFVDPRLDACCKLQKQVLSSPFAPKVSEGTMLIFPSQLVHFVVPYTGRAPRITLSWNLNEQAVPGNPIPG